MKGIGCEPFCVNSFQHTSDDKRVKKVKKITECHIILARFRMLATWEVCLLAVCATLCVRQQHIRTSTSGCQKSCLTLWLWLVPEYRQPEQSVPWHCVPSCVCTSIMFAPGYRDCSFTVLGAIPAPCWSTVHSFCIPSSLSHISAEEVFIWGLYLHVGTTDNVSCSWCSTSCPITCHEGTAEVEV
jgi:hypothetical protein